MVQVLRRTKGSSGRQGVVYRHTDGHTYSAMILGFTSGALSTPGVPVVTNIGTPGAGANSYRIVARNSSGVTLAGTGGTTATANATLSATNFNRVTWSAVTGAESYDVYGRTAAAELFMANVFGLQFDDIGIPVTPAGALPGGNTTAAGYNIYVPALKLVTAAGGQSRMVKNGVQANTTRAATGVIVVGR